MKKQINCKDVMSHICESLGEEINSPKCIAIKNHLENCNECKSYFNSIEKTISFYKMYNLELPQKSHKKLMSLLNLEED